jgi:hypothetical protein
MKGWHGWNSGPAPKAFSADFSAQKSEAVGRKKLARGPENTDGTLPESQEPEGNRTMDIPHIPKKMIAATLLSGGVAVAGLVLAPRTAHAEIGVRLPRWSDLSATGQISGAQEIRSSI